MQKSALRNHYRNTTNKHSHFNLVSKNFTQQSYIDAIDNNDVTIATGSAGTGKTYIALHMACNLFTMGEISNIVITRPNIECGKELGSLPGDLEEKLDPWVATSKQLLKQCTRNEMYTCLIKNTEFEALQYMRGKTFDNAFIFCDEAQNLTVDQIKMLTTRIGVNSKLVICGDTNQSDLFRTTSGLQWLVDHIKHYQLPIDIINFTLNECVRSDVCKMFLELYENVD